MTDSDAFYLVPPPSPNKAEPVLKELIPANEELPLPDISVSLASQDDGSTGRSDQPNQQSGNAAEAHLDVNLHAKDPEIPRGGLEDIASRADDIALPPQKIIPEKKEMPNLGS
jgi:hypothetical protein